MTTQAQESQLDAAEGRDAEEPRQRPLLTRMGAELVGTFVLVTAIITVAGFGSIGANATMLYVALAGGIALMALVAALGAVSGAHLNPAVSLGAAIAGRLPWLDLAPYVVAQILGGIGAGALLRALTPSTLPAALGLTDVKDFISSTSNGFGVNSPLGTASDGAVTFSTTQALLVEIVCTALLVGVVLAVTKRPSPVAPAAIGGALAVGILIAGQVTNAALNPARATATAFFAEPWALQQLWLFWLAPLVGGLIAGLIAVTFETAPEAAEEWDDEDDYEPEEPAEPDAWHDTSHERVIDADGEPVVETDPDAVGLEAEPEPVNEPEAPAEATAEEPDEDPENRGA